MGLKLEYCRNVRPRSSETLLPFEAAKVRSSGSNRQTPPARCMTCLMAQHGPHEFDHGARAPSSVACRA